VPSSVINAGLARGRFQEREIFDLYESSLTAIGFARILMWDEFKDFPCQGLRRADDYEYETDRHDEC